LGVQGSTGGPMKANRSGSLQPNWQTKCHDTKNLSHA
jgi:hypothetical protein